MKSNTLASFILLAIAVSWSALGQWGGANNPSYGIPETTTGAPAWRILSYSGNLTIYDDPDAKSVIVIDTSGDLWPVFGIGTLGKSTSKWGGLYLGGAITFNDGTTLSSMSGLLTSASAATTFAPINSPTFTGTPTLSAGGLTFSDASIQTTAGVPSGAVYTVYAGDPKWTIDGTGATDAEAAISTMFQSAAASTAASKVIIFKPGSTYLLGMQNVASNIALFSNLKVIADGATFALPTSLSVPLSGNTDYPLLRCFVAPANIQNFTWQGGTVVGYGFDLTANTLSTNNWQTTNGVCFIQARGSATAAPQNITIDKLTAYWLGGPAVDIEGYGITGSNGSGITTNQASNITIRDCNFDHCGAPLWDYQRAYNWLAFYPTNLTTQNWQFASNNMVAQSTIIGAVTTTSGSTTVPFNNSPTIVPVSAAATPQNCVFFYGPTMPTYTGQSTPTLRFGYPYYVVASSSTGISISLTYGGAAISFSQTMSSGLYMVYGINNNYVFPGTRTRVDLGYNPTYNGAWQVSYASNVVIRGNRWSGCGDSHTLFQSSTVSMMNNIVSSAVMGCLFVGNQCSDVLIEGNIFNGNNGSRVLTIEDGSTQIAVIGNKFLNGGRGLLANNVSGLTFSGNICNNLTIKNNPVPGLGQWDFTYGNWSGNNGFLFGAIPGSTFITTSTNIVITGNTFFSTNSPRLFQFSPFMNGLTVTGNHINGSYPVNVYGQVNRGQGLPGMLFGLPPVRYTVEANEGMKTIDEGTYTFTLGTSSTNLVIPHSLSPNVWGYNYNAYAPAYSIQVSGLGVIYPVTNSADTTNIYVGYSGTIPTGMPLTVQYRIKSISGIAGQPTFVGTTDTDAYNYISAVAANGGNLSGTETLAISALIAGFKSDGNWSHIVGLYPLRGGFNGFNVAAKLPLGLSLVAPYAGIVETNITSRGPYFDGVSSWISTPLSAGNVTGNGGFPSTLVGGVGLFVNDTTYNTANSTAIPVGIYNGTDRYGFTFSNNNFQGYWGGATSATSGTQTMTSQSAIVQRSSATSLVLSEYTGGNYSTGTFTSGTAVVTSTTPAGGGTDTMGIGGRVRSGVLYNGYAGVISFVVFTDGAATASTLASRITTFLAATGVTELP